MTPSAGIGPATSSYGGSGALVNDVPMPAVVVNKPTDGGATFADAVVVAVDRYSDKERLAIGSRSARDRLALREVKRVLPARRTLQTIGR